MHKFATRTFHELLNIKTAEAQISNSNIRNSSCQLSVYLSDDCKGRKICFAKLLAGKQQQHYYHTMITIQLCLYVAQFGDTQYRCCVQAVFIITIPSCSIRVLWVLAVPRGCPAHKACGGCPDHRARKGLPVLTGRTAQEDSG